MTAAEDPPADSQEVCARLVDAVRLDLVGPWAGHALGAEQLPGRERPSNWYVAGFLIPTGTPPDRSGDADEDDDIDTVPESAGLSEESNDERKAARKAFFPSSIGLSFLVAGTCHELAVTARWGDYAQADIEEADGGKATVWRRTPREETLSIPFDGSAGPVVRDVPGSNGLQLHVAERPIDTMGLSGAHLPAGTRSVSCFLVNRRTPDEAQPTGPTPSRPRSRCAPPRASCRGRTCAGRTPAIGMIGSRTSTTPIRRSTPPGMACRPSGSWSTASAARSARRGSERRK